MKTISWLGVVGVFVGMGLSQILTSRFGVNGQLAIICSIVVTFLVCILYFILRRQFFASLFMFIMVFPLIIGFIGMYIDNYTISGFGIVSIFIVYPLFAKWMKSLDTPYKDNLWYHKGRW